MTTQVPVTDLSITRHITASPNEVFDVWLDPKCEASMWNGAEQLVLDPTEGALFYWVVNHKGERVPHYGRFLIVDRSRGRIEHTWVSEYTHGIETTVAITLTPSASGGTDLRLVHSGLCDDEMGRGHEAGWSSLIADVVARFEAPARA